jgi:GAF domain-containing protein
MRGSATDPYELARVRTDEALHSSRPDALLQRVVDLLQEGFEHYGWTGIYLLEGDDLALAAWSGPQATQHTRIPIGQGVCGAAAATGRTEVVDDVSADSRYLMCFPSTRSEIVVPITRAAEVLGEIDVDSDRPAAFGARDREFLEGLADRLAERLPVASDA